MKTDKETLELALEEQRRDYDVLLGLYESIKLKNFTFLTAALGLMGYLYTSSANANKGEGLREKLFIPDESYGVILYAFGLVLILFAISILMVALTKTRTWSTAFDANLDELAPKQYDSYLKFMHKRYLDIARTNCRSYDFKRQLINLSFIPLVLGGTILLLLKTFGG